MVEWKYLGEVANLVRGRVISKDYIRDFEGEYPVYSSQTANDGVLGYINSYMFDGNYLTWTTDGAYAGTIFRRKGKFSITNVCGLIDITCRNIKQDFLYFWLSKTAKDYVLEGMGNPKLMSNVASTILIPIPSLEEQTRIVGILDTFISAIDNLKEQIAQRRKQYEYYRDQLLDLEGKSGVEMKKLGEIATLQKTKNKQHLTENAYSITQAGLVPTKSFFKEKTNVTSSDTSGYYIVEKDWFVYSPSRIDVGSINYLKDEGPVIVSPIDVVFSVDSNICIPAYLLEYFFTYKGKKDLLKNREGVEGMGRRNLPFDAIKGVQIPLQPLSEQQRIVSILDTFEASIQNLEAQLKERQKQYEYYRNKLLSFE